MRVLLLHFALVLVRVVTADHATGRRAEQTVAVAVVAGNAAAQYAGLAALTGPQDEVHKMVAEFDKRRQVVVAGLNRLPGISCATPKGAFYAFPNVKRTGWAAKALASALLEDSAVAIIGGPDFGILGEGYVRLSYANSTENILKALDRMGDFLATRKAA